MGGGKGGGKGGERRREREEAGPRRKVGMGRITGIVEEWKGKFGWVQPDEPIDHPEARKKRGKVFLGQEDVEQDLPGVGCRVSFFVYADGTGLGAMNCVPAGRTSGPRGMQKATTTTPARAKPTPSRSPLGGTARPGAAPAGKAKTNDNAGGQSKKSGDTPPDPAARTTISTAPVQGKVVKWMGKFGFIAPDEPLDIPEMEAKKGNRSGQIYCHANDVEGEMPVAGAVVIFFVYSDPNGIGAEMCQVVEQGDGEAVEIAPKADKTEDAEADAEMGDGDGEKKAARTRDNKRRGGRGRREGLGGGGDRPERKKGLSGPDLPRERVSEIPITGEVTNWKGMFGWIKPLEEVDHPDSKKNRGGIYVHKKDLVGVEELEQGQTVQFYVFSDPSGLGAEEVAVL